MAYEVDASSCTVCQEIYNDPRFLLCGHSFCLQCIRSLAGNRQKFPCPICRFTVDLRNGKVDQLPKNFVLSNVIEAKGMTQPSMCLEHKKLLDIYCEGCDVVICSKCLSAQHKGHAIEDIDKIFVERNDKLSAFLETTKMWTSIILERRNVVQQSIHSMETNADSINKTVDNMFKKWKDDLQAQQNKALRYLQLEREKKIQLYHEAESVFKNSMTDVTSLESEISKIMTKDTTFVIQQYGSVKARKEDTERRVLVMVKQCLTPPDDLKMELIAPWMEEAIDNITLTNMVHKEARPEPQKIAEIQRENIILKRHKEEWREENKDWKKRLSKLAGDRLTHENLNITDLNDVHRPTKLSDTYCELYDNEWTDAFQELTDHGLTDKEAVRTLLDILLVCFHKCREITWERYQTLKHIVSTIDIVHIPRRVENLSEVSDPFISTNNISQDLDILCSGKREVQRSKQSKEEHFTTTVALHFEQEKQIKDIWRTTTTALKNEAVKHLYLVLLTRFDIPIKDMEKTSKYLTSCIDLCWKMGVQEQPMHLEAVAEKDIDSEKIFDQDKFKAFTKSGEGVDFVVWPALFLHEGGPMLFKGIAQGCNKSHKRNNVIH